MRYRITAPPGPLTVCHCRLCQRQSGSAFGMSLAVAPESFELTAGALKTFEATADSGRVKTCAFCPDCGCRIFHRSEDGLSVKAGTLDEPSLFRAEAHYWVVKALPWITIPAGAERFERDG